MPDVPNPDELPHPPPATPARPTSAPTLDDSSLPPPAPHVVPPPLRVPREGELVPAWRATLIITWVGVFLAWLAVWKTSEEIGLATWWLGPRSNPQSIAVRLIPFVLTAFVGILASYHVRRMPWISLAGAVLLALIALPDLSRSVGLAAVELAIAGAAALVSIAATTGMYRAETVDR